MALVMKLKMLGPEQKYWMKFNDMEEVYNSSSSFSPTIEYTISNNSGGIGWYDKIEDLVKSENGDKYMKRCEVDLPDGNGKAQIGENCFFLCPTHSGFMLYLNPNNNGIEIHCFESFAGVITYLQNNTILDLTHTMVANNI